MIQLFPKIQAQNQFSSVPLSSIIDSIKHYQKVDQVKAKTLLSSVEKQFINQHDPGLKSQFYNLKGKLNKREKIYADSALHFAKIANDSLLIAKAYNQLGIAYNSNLDNKKALEIFSKVQDFSNQKEEIYFSNIYSADLFLDNNDFKNAKDYLLKAKSLVPLIDEELHIKLFSSYGYVYMNTEELDSSKLYYTKSLDLCEKYQYERQALITRENLGIIEHEQGNTELAENIFLTLLNEADKLGDKQLMLYAYTDLIWLYKDLKDNERAIEAGKKQLELASEYGNIKYTGNAARLLYKIYEQEKDYENAYKYLKVYKTAADSLAKGKKGISELKVSDQFKEQHIIDSLQVVNAEITLSSEKHKRENITWLFALALFATIISITQFFRTKRAQKRSDELLLNILPKTTAEELKTGATTTKRYDHVSILFADLKNFTTISSKLSPEQLVEMLDFYFCTFDTILKKWNVEKIKTIGDAYMAVYGIDKTYSSQTINIVQAALEMQEFIKENQHPHIKNLANEILEMRIGIHTGSLVAGVVGKTKFQFDVWGDAVNIASRIESGGEAGKVNLSISTYNEIKKSDKLQFTPRGSIKIKNRGEIEMFFVRKKNQILSQHKVN